MTVPDLLAEFVAGEALHAEHLQSYMSSQLNLGEDVTYVRCGIQLYAKGNSLSQWRLGNADY